MKKKEIQFCLLLPLLLLGMTASAHSQEAPMPVINLDPLNISGQTPGFAAAFREKEGPVNVTSADAVVDDSAGTGLTAINIRVVPFSPDDLLLADTAETDMIATYQDGVLHITGRNIGGWDSAESYQAILRTVIFKNDSPNPDESPRQIEVRSQRENKSGEPLVCMLTVTAVNDPPVNTVPGSQFTPRDVPLIFSPGNGNRISVSDADAGDGEMSADIHAELGLVSVTADSAALVDGNNSSHLSIKGTLDDLNRELSRLRYDPPLGWIGTMTLTILSDDQGHTGFPGPLSDSDTVSITAGVPVAPEPPVADAGADQTVEGSGIVTLNGSASYAKEGEIITYAWSQIGGSPGVVLKNADTAFPSFTAPQAGELEKNLTFQLKVTDSNDLWAADTVRVTVRGNSNPDSGAGDSGGCFMRSLIR